MIKGFEKMKYTIRKSSDYRVPLRYFCRMTVRHKMVGLERITYNVFNITEVNSM